MAHSQKPTMMRVHAFRSARMTHVMMADHALQAVLYLVSRVKIILGIFFFKVAQDAVRHSARSLCKNAFHLFSVFTNQEIAPLRNQTSNKLLNNPLQKPTRSYTNADT